MGKFFSLILQKHGDNDGWMPENEGLEATGNLRAKSPIRIRTKGHGSMVSWAKQWWCWRPLTENQLAF